MLALAFPVRVSAAEAWSASELHAKLILRALVYDRHLKATLSGPLVGAVLHDPDDAKAADATAAAFRSLAVMRFAGREIVVERIPVGEDAGFASRLRQAQASVVYTCPGLDTAQLDRVMVAAEARGLLTVTGVGAHVREYGACLGVVAESGRPTVLINLDACRPAGADFSSVLLGLAQLVEPP